MAAAGGTCSYVAVVGRDGGVYVKGKTFYGELDEKAAVQAEGRWVPLFVPVKPRTGARCLACGVNFVLVVTEGDGRVFHAGHRSAFVDGAAGGRLVSASETGLVQVDFSCSGCKSPIVTVAAGESHALVVSSLGEVFSFGSNALGQLGRGGEDKGVSPRPGRVRLPAQANGTPTLAAAVSCGWGHSAVMTRGGRVCTFGGGLHGELGDGEGEERVPEPSFVDVLDDGLSGGGGIVAAISLGARHSAALTKSGELLVWGQIATFRTRREGGDGGSGSNGELALSPRHMPLPEEAHCLALSSGAKHIAVVCEGKRRSKCGDGDGDGGGGGGKRDLQRQLLVSGSRVVVERLEFPGGSGMEAEGGGDRKAAAGHRRGVKTERAVVEEIDVSGFVWRRMGESAHPVVASAAWGKVVTFDVEGF